VIAVKRFLFICLITVFPKTPFLIHFLNYNALRRVSRDDLPQRCQFSSLPATELIAIFYPGDGKS